MDTLMHTPAARFTLFLNIIYKIKAIIYDIDNCVALGSNSDITIAWDPFLARYFGISLEEATRLRMHYFENPPGCSLTGMAAHFNIPESKRKDWTNGIYAKSGHASGRRFMSRYTPVKGEKEAYKAVHRLGIKQMVITQGHPSHYVPITKHVGLWPYVRSRNRRIDRTSEQSYEKLEAAVWQRAQEELNVEADEILVFEDSPRNLIHPAARGMHTAYVGDRAYPAGFDASSIHHRFESVPQALNLLISHHS